MPARTDAFRDFIASDSFPCVGAKSALARNELTIFEAGSITGPQMDVEIRNALSEFIDVLDPSGPTVQSFAILFDGPDDLTETGFETAMWNRLQCLHNMDVAAGEEWAPEVNDDPKSSHFSMSLMSEPFFIIGLHPHASRPARRFKYPAMVFNSHEQFERLRQDGRYQKMQEIIRERDTALAGDINPMVEDFGGSSEALQYSGRLIDENWTCPFSKKEVAH